MIRELKAQVEKASGRLLGRTGINHGEGWPGFEIGWTLGRQHWGRGFATEAARAALEHSFGVLGQRHVISLIQAANPVGNSGLSTVG